MVTRSYQDAAIMRQILLYFIIKNNKKQQTAFKDHAHLKELEQDYYSCLFTSGLWRIVFKVESWV